MLISLAAELLARSDYASYYGNDVLDIESDLELLEDALADLGTDHDGPQDLLRAGMPPGYIGLVAQDAGSAREFAYFVSLARQETYCPKNLAQATHLLLLVRQPALGAQVLAELACLLSTDVGAVAILAVKFLDLWRSKTQSQLTQAALLRHARLWLSPLDADAVVPAFGLLFRCTERALQKPWSCREGFLPTLERVERLVAKVAFYKKEALDAGLAFPATDDMEVLWDNEELDALFAACCANLATREQRAEPYGTVWSGLVTEFATSWNNVCASYATRSAEEKELILGLMPVFEGTLFEAIAVAHDICETNRP